MKRGDLVRVHSDYKIFPRILSKPRHVVLSFGSKFLGRVCHDEICVVLDTTSGFALDGASGLRSIKILTARGIVGWVNKNLFEKVS